MKKREVRKELKLKRERQVRKLEREHYKIWVAIDNLGWITLPRPIRDGWYRTYKLRDDIVMCKFGKDYQEILDKAVVKVWGRDKRNADKNHYQNIKSLNYFNRFQYPGIKFLTCKEFRSLSKSAQKYFYTVQDKRYWFKCYKHYTTIPRHYFVLKYERAYITKRRIQAPELERRKDEIEIILLNNKFYNLSSFNTYSHRSFSYRFRYSRAKTNSILSSLDIEKISNINNYPKSKYIY